MSRLRLVLRFIVLAAHAATALILTMSAPAHATIVINDGASVSISYDIFDHVNVYDGGCNPSVEWPRVSPGPPTQVSLVSGGFVELMKVYQSSTITMDGGSVEQSLQAYDSSTITMRAGTVGNDLNAFGSPTVEITGGSVLHDLEAHQSSTITMSGGTLGNSMFAEDESTIEVVGAYFAVNGLPVPYGDLTAQTGTLTGVLASGDFINNVFYQGGGSYTGTITLVPEPSTALLLAFGLVGLAVGGRQRGL